MAEIKTVAVLGYESCSEQDTITPLEIFKGAAMVLAQQIAPWPMDAEPAELDVKLVSLDPGNVVMQMGTQVVPDAVLEDGQLFDILYVPGGVGSGKMTQDGRILDAIRHHHVNGKVIAANCSGVGILSRSGILGDTPVTCVAAVARGLRAEGTNVPSPRRMWLHDAAKKIWTTTGSYGVNGSTVALVTEYFGKEVGTIVSMMFDTYGGLGEQIYAASGPEFYVHPDLEEKFTDFFEPMLLPGRGAQA
ncbi:DJ-1/PfpI family protein [Streptomyces sp. NPDC006632]|uniref:DJ-1/PfpI family protein n=1 Tax=unclassified Streptomyces TaxID=2593676 RepID=UPI002E20FA00